MPPARFMTASAVSSSTSRWACRDRKGRSPAANEQSPDLWRSAWPAYGDLPTSAPTHTPPPTPRPPRTRQGSHAQVVVARPLRPGDPHAACPHLGRPVWQVWLGPGGGWATQSPPPPGVRSPPRQGRPLPNGPARPGGTHVVINGHGRARIPHVCAILIPSDDPQSGPPPFTGRRGPPRSTRPLQSPLGSQPLRWPAPPSGGSRRR